MKKRNWMAGVCGAAVMGLLIAGTGTASAGTIPTGFQVGGFDLSGMTREEADQTIGEIDRGDGKSDHFDPGRRS